MSNIRNDIENLAGKILLATLAISNEYLSKSMVFVCCHDKNGAMGLVVNKLLPDISAQNTLKKLNINVNQTKSLEIHFGGLEESDKCFILHSGDYLPPKSTLIKADIALTTNADIIKSFISGECPQKKIVCVGCCIWENKQLEKEVASSYWIPIESDEDLIFGDSKADKWSKALLKIGSRTNLLLDARGNA